MLIKSEEALRLSQESDYHDFPVNYLEEINIPAAGVNYKPEMLFRPGHYDILNNAAIKEINVFYTPELYEKLCGLFPVSYQRPSGRKGIVEFDKIMESIEDANANSQRKRHVISLCETYKKTDAGYSSVIHFGEKIDSIRWNQLKSGLNRSTSISYALSESGIIIFFILNPKGPDYAQKFMNFTELVSILVSGHTAGAGISGDVYTVNEASKLLKTYHDTNASLVVIGEDLNEEYTHVLKSLKAYDRYARIMQIKKADHAAIGRILADVKTAYNKHLWENGE